MRWIDVINKKFKLFFTLTRKQFNLFDEVVRSSIAYEEILVQREEPSYIFYRC